MKTAGYETAAFVGAFVLDRRFGLAQGFDTYDDQIPRDPNATERLEAERPASAVVDRALAWFERPRLSPRPQPQVASPLLPVDPPLRSPRAIQSADEFRARTRTPYDGEIAFADAQIARVFEWLRAHGQIDRTLIVVAGDHGEGLGDHGERTHGMLLYDSTLRVPLIVASPGRPAGVRDEAVSLADLAPTIARAAGVTPPDAMNGHDLLAPVQRQSQLDGRPDLYSETEYPRVAGWSPLQALTDGRWMTIRAGASTEVYDLQNDAGEQRDVAAAQATIAAAMAARIDALRAANQPTAGTSVISKEAEERLRALGYVASSVQPASGAGGPNPATRITTWNAFEEALSSLNAHRPDALPALRMLATANPDALVFQTTYARALKDAGHVTPALAAYRQAARRWPHERDAAPRSGGGGARGRTRHERSGSPRAARRSRARRSRPRSRSLRAPRSRTTASASRR